jgi:putative FmdB family regulatory protein
VKTAARLRAVPPTFALLREPRRRAKLHPAMPIYEYRCDKCRRTSSVLTTRISEKVEPVCSHCGSKDMQRLLSRFAMPKSEEARLDSLSDSAMFSGVDENDPKSVARMMRRMGKEMGEEFSTPEFDEAIEELESGGGEDDSDGGTGGDDL